MREPQYAQEVISSVSEIRSNPDGLKHKQNLGVFESKAVRGYKSCMLAVLAGVVEAAGRSEVGCSGHCLAAITIGDIVSRPDL